MKRLILATTAALLVFACGGTSNTPQTAASSGPPEKSSLKVGVGGQAQLIYMPLTLADQLGYFKAEGITIEIDDLKGGSDALKALLGGSVDMVTGFYEHTVRTQTQGKFIEDQLWNPFIPKAPDATIGLRYLDGELEFSPDGSRLVVSDSNLIRIFKIGG